MRTYCAKSNRKVDDDERLTCEIVRKCILIAENSGLRAGDQRPLRWNDVEVERRNANGEQRVGGR